MLLVGIVAGVSPGLAAPVTFAFKATNQDDFFVFDVGDTVHGTFTFDDAEPTGNGEMTSTGLTVLSRQEAPQADLTIVYTEASSGETAVGRIYAMPNPTPDLEIVSSVFNLSFRYEDLETDENLVFGPNANFTFNTVSFRFNTYPGELPTPPFPTEVPQLPLDIERLGPTFITMQIGVGSRVGGPNFVIDYVRRIPEPSGWVLLMTLATAGWARTQ